MRISVEQYTSLLVRLAASHLDDDARTLIKGWEYTTTSDDGRVEIVMNETARQALERLLGMSISAPAGPSAAGYFAPFAIESFRYIYDKSIALQSIAQEILNDPDLLIAELFRLRENPTNELTNYALVTLVYALYAGGKITGNAQTYQRLAGARDLYDKSPTLQAIPETALATPFALVEWLIDNREKIITEQRKVREVGAGDLETYALGTLVLALYAGGEDYGRCSTLPASGRRARFV